MNAQTKPEAVLPPEIVAAEVAELEKDRELRREERRSLTAIPAADLATVPQRTSFLPASMGEALQFAALMARSNFVPGHMRGKDGDCMAIVMQAARWGMDPFAVANKSYFVKDGAPPAFEAQLINAVVNSSGALSGRLRVEFFGEGEKLRCTVSGYLRADPNDEKIKTQHISRVTVRNSPLWKADPEQQLAYYTTRAWARLWVPEVLMGVYTPDEMDIDPERARVVSPPLPRREDPINLIGTSGLDVGGVEDDEETQRLLDAETTAQIEGRDDEDRGELFATDDTRDVAQVEAERIKALFKSAPDKPAYMAAMALWNQNKGQIEAYDASLAADVFTAEQVAKQRLGVE